MLWYHTPHGLWNLWSLFLHEQQWLNLWCRNLTLILVRLVESMWAPNPSLTSLNLSRPFSWTSLLRLETRILKALIPRMLVTVVRRLSSMSSIGSKAAVGTVDTDSSSRVILLSMPMVRLDRWEEREPWLCSSDLMHHSSFNVSLLTFISFTWSAHLRLTILSPALLHTFNSHSRYSYG